jgi:hypothetical protein
VAKMLLSATSLITIAGGGFVLTSLLLFGSTMVDASFSDDEAQARVGHEFKIKAGDLMKIDGEDLKIKFKNVAQDSRCPEDVNCVWAGNAEVLLELTEGKCTTALTLNTQDSNALDKGKAGHYRFKLVKLDPYPRSDRKIAPGDYVATLLVSKE